ncbi:MAG: T9SS type A sorting domain-containing protein, partial [Bacteroidota bacterium]|nr:T9SS type A sorting domain-containing protein [Bacteroidota bacterium]
PYPQHGYNHSGWLAGDGEYFVFADETGGKELKLYGTKNLKDSVTAGDGLEFFSTFGLNADKGSVAHNPFIKDHLVYVSYYHEGVVVFDISDPYAPRFVTRYDTYPQNTDASGHTNYKDFHGCWGVYPFLPSGNIIASDMSNGLFVFKLDTFNVYDTPWVARVLSNPIENELRLFIGTDYDQTLVFRLYDMRGKEQAYHSSHFIREDHNFTFTLPEYLSQGMYILSIEGEGITQTFKTIKIR